MNEIPLPGPVDAADYDFENYERDIAHQTWQSALDWAKKGDFASLAQCLRYEASGPPADPLAVRNFLADVLEGKFKKPRNSKAKRYPERVMFVDAAGRRLQIEKRYLKQATAIKRVRELRASRRLKQAKAVEIVALEMGLDEEKVAGYVQNPRREWGLSQLTAEEMFAGIVPPSKE
ncbi:hypothetical protein [Nitrobacter sp. JJSN]|uniref:hypothetical protein n=1 Tax=Nitrobacter sp. JJSN TaxID=3453033 RepID=UPI003F758A0D